MDTNYGMIPPSAIELEKIVLGALMIEQEAFDKVNLLIDEDSFYNPSHQSIFRACKTLYQENKLIDLMTVIEELQRADKLEVSGGYYYISQLTSNVASAVNLIEHAKILREKQIQRKIILHSQELLKAAFNPACDPQELISSLGNVYEELNNSLSSSLDMISVSKVVKDALSNFMDRQEKLKNGIIEGITTGSKELDQITGRLKPGEVTIIAARASMGKTAFALNLAINAASENKNISIVSLEMTPEALTTRMLVRESENINSDVFKYQIAKEEEIKEINRAAGRIEKLPVCFIKSMNLTLEGLKARCRVLKKKNKLDLLIIDYLQLMDGQGKANNREQEIAKISRGLKLLSLELNIPIVILSQLNRELEKRTDKKPFLSDLRESGSIEQDADIVILLNRPEKYGSQTVKTKYGEISTKNLLVCDVAKNRNGKIAPVFLLHNETMTKITDYENTHLNPF